MIAVTLQSYEINDRLAYELSAHVSGECRWLVSEDMECFPYVRRYWVKLTWTWSFDRFRLAPFLLICCICGFKRMSPFVLGLLL